MTTERTASSAAFADAGRLTLSFVHIIEFDAAAVRQLLDAAGGPLFEHTVARLRSARASAQAYAEAVARYREQGYTVLEDNPRGRWGDTSLVPLGHLLTREGAEATQAAITNPAHWAVLLDEDTGWADRDSGELVDEEGIDWSTEGNPDATPAEGMRHADSVVETTVFEPEWYCTDYAAAGLELTGIYRRNAERSDATDTDASSADAEAARLQREAEQAEAAKRERRKVLALNKLGAAAATVRREFLTRLLARRTPPKGAAVFVADCLARDKGLLNEYHADEIAAELLGVSDTNALRTQAKGLGAGGDARAQVITLALVLGACENRLPKDAWRNPGGGWLYFVKGSEYLQFLAAQGYTLSPVEEIVTAARDADAVFDEQASSQEATE